MDWEKLYKEINPTLFTMLDGNPIVFYFELEDTEQKAKWEKLVCLGYGDFVEKLVEMDSKTALMVDDLNPSLFYSRPSFKLSYITDCVKQNSLLDIGDYLHNSYFKKSDLYMKVIFYGTETFKLETHNGASSKQLNIEDEGTSNVTSSKQSKVDKWTRAPYTRTEKEDILKFIISKPKHSLGLNGNTIWKNMELRNICPQRTYQSLKNHFRKFLIKELDRYEFLTNAQKKFLRGETDRLP